MKWLLTLAALIFTTTLATAEHYYPEVGEDVTIGGYCETLADAQAIILSGMPTTIPDDIDCWLAMVRLKGTVGSVAGEAGQYDILEVVDVKKITREYSYDSATDTATMKDVQTKFGAEGSRFFIPIKRDDGDA